MSAALSPLRRAEGLALWRQITGLLRSEIGSGVYGPGARLPTEAQLAVRFGVNRHTVRRALESLSRAGLIRIEQGRGTFVSEDMLEYAIRPRTRFSEWIRQHNKEPSGRILKLAEISADAAVAAYLKVRPGARLAVLERAGFADAQPVGIFTHYFNLARLPGLMAALRAHDTISAALASVGVADYRRALTRVSARLPTVDEAALLQIPRTRPVLSTETVDVDEAGAVIAFGTAIYPTPRVQIVFEP